MYLQPTYHPAHSWAVTVDAAASFVLPTVYSIFHPLSRLDSQPIHD
jgi:hypothetical protein